MKIINFGSCNIDYVYSLDHIVAPGETESTYNMEIFPGGKGLNQSIAAARAGADVFHVGCVGEDGKFLLDVLKDSNVDISCIKRSDEKNGHAIIQVSACGENSIFLYPGSNQHFTTTFIDEVLAKFDEGDIVMLQNEINHVEYIIEQAYQRKMCIILNPSPFNGIIRKINLNRISYLILNEVEAKSLTQYNESKEILGYFKEHYPSLKVVLTLGSRGSIYMDHTQELYYPAFHVDVVDTTGAGDTFAGYFASGIAKRMECLKILKMATAAAAIAISKKGAATSIPYKKEVLEYEKLYLGNRLVDGL